jgi:hypothetical protein
MGADVPDLAAQYVFSFICRRPNNLALLAMARQPSGSLQKQKQKTFHFRKEWVALLFETSNMPKMLHVSLAT